MTNGTNPETLVNGVRIPSPASGGGSSTLVLGSGSDFSVNAAAVNGGYQDGSIVLRTGTRVNAAGGFNGGGTGNKSIAGVFGFSGLPIADLASIAYRWNNEDGPGGPFFIPPGGPSVTTPYINFIVDFGAAGLKICVVLDDSLAGAITAAIGSYQNDGSNNLTYSWLGATQDILIVGQVPPAPGGVAPNVTVGPGWLENSYKWTDIIAANPGAVLMDAFTGDGGLPAGAVTPSIMLVSGDSGNLVRSGKSIRAFLVNGGSVL